MSSIEEAKKAEIIEQNKTDKIENRTEYNNVLASTFGEQKRWVNWKYEEVEEGRVTKLPTSLDDRTASITDPSNWSTYKEVENASENIGIVFTADQLLLGIDIDHCLEGNEIVHEERDNIIKLIKEAETYTEVSPSNNGLHLYLSLTTPLQLIANRKGSFEAYTAGRYFTVTNNPYYEALPVRTITPNEAIALLSIIGYPWGKQAMQQTAIVPVAIPVLDDEIILSKMFASQKGNKIKLLYNGDTTAHNNDDSVADLALCSHLAYWTDCNAEQIERLWLGSPLGERTKTRIRKDYRDRTIGKAIESVGIDTQREKTQDVVIHDKFQLTSWNEFFRKEFPEIRWRINNLIPMEGFVILSAISGEKKTWVSLEMAKCIALGINFLGTDLYKTKMGKVLYVDQENPERDIVRRGKQLGIEENKNLFIFRPDSLNLNDEHIANKFIKFILDHNIEVVFIDTFRAVAGGLKEDKAEDVRMFFNRFKIFKDRGIVVVWLDHRRKPQNFEGKKPKKEQLLGSQDKTASVEVLLQLSSDSGSDEIRVYQAKNRLDREIEPFKILMKDNMTGNGVQKTSLVYDGLIEADETKKDEAKESILELLQESGKTTKEVCSVLGNQKKIGEKNVRSALKELTEGGMIDYTKKGHQNFYAIKEDMQDDQQDNLLNF
ncbi:MAG: AAA family ATPase [Patescibacteria group bacterium]|jgi:hypothetical protein